MLHLEHGAPLRKSNVPRHYGFNFLMAVICIAVPYIGFSLSPIYIHMCLVSR
ncbi:hypothetical protein HanIR_Chr11g0547501 [Helianthus annuus]|nr:hypothetical protein HanIR_Chr11g0547501 [Helianthus annuus]